MKRIIAIFITLILCAMGELWAFSGVTVKVYKGNSSYSGDVVCNIKDGPLTFPEFIAVWYVVNYIY